MVYVITMIYCSFGVYLYNMKKDLHAKADLKKKVQIEEVSGVK